MPMGPAYLMDVVGFRYHCRIAIRLCPMVFLSGLLMMRRTAYASPIENSGRQRSEKWRGLL